jgi:hypothetical protein
VHIDPPLLSAISALFGALIGGGASLPAAIYTQRYQNRLQRVARETAKREAVYADLIMNRPLSSTCDLSRADTSLSPVRFRECRSRRFAMLQKVFAFSARPVVRNQGKSAFAHCELPRCSPPWATHQP